jgi:predicted enzyme related to lactoylglutathione lyase
MQKIETLQVTGVDFVVMPTSDFETAVAFYGTIIGLRRSAYRPERRYAEFETGNLTLMVTLGRSE